MKLIKQLLLVLPLIIGSMAMPVLAGDKDPLFINLSTDNTPRVDHALHFGNVHFSKGHPLTIFLNGKGVLLASKGHAAKYAGQQKALAEMMDKGAVVIVCQYCMKQVGVKESQLLPGFKVGNPELTGGALFKDNTKTLSW
ncbi:MAG: DsrE family protein [Hydrogenophilaceae bacterium]|nr:DsrE family protein [Hydrogenophilaceae bacterium]